MTKPPNADDEVLAVIVAALKAGHVVKIILVSDDGRTVEGVRGPRAWTWRQDQAPESESGTDLADEVRRLREGLARILKSGDEVGGEDLNGYWVLDQIDGLLTDST